jgi:uncharacterized protein YkwD
MSRRRNTILALTVLLALSFSLPPAWGQLYKPKKAASKSANRPIRLKEVEKRIFSLTNEERRKHGLPKLDHDDTLAEVALQHSFDMLKRDFFSHTNPDGQSVKDRFLDAPARIKLMGSVGENIAGSSGHDYAEAKTIARYVVDGWMTSPGHRANILNPNYAYLGVGVGVLGKDFRATQNFGTKKSP